MNNNQIQIRAIEDKIFLLRGHKIMLDAHLATLYGVEIRILIRNVKRNIQRFPSDFMFQLNSGEYSSLRSQFGILKEGRGQHRKYLPYAFTENGIAMLSSVLRSKTAIDVNIQIMRTFTKYREYLMHHRDLEEKMRRVEQKYDGKFVEVFNRLQKLEDVPEKSAPANPVKGFGKA